MKIDNKLIKSGLILNLIGFVFVLLLILNSWLGYGFLLFLEIVFLLLVLSSITLNIYFYLGELKSLKLVGFFSLIVAVFMFFIGFYIYQETPLILIVVGSSLLIYSDYKNTNSSSYKPEKNFKSTNAYLSRAELFLEDKNFAKTIEYCEKALDQDSRLGLAYLYKLLALNAVVSIEQYILMEKPLEKFIEDPLYKRFKQFTPINLIEIRERPILIELEKMKVSSSIVNLLSMEDKAENLELLERNLIALTNIHPYKSSEALIMRLEGKIAITKELITESRYLEAIELTRGDSYQNLKNSLVLFSNLSNYKESKKYIKRIKVKLIELDRLRRKQALKFAGKFSLIVIVLAIVFNLTNTYFFKYYTLNLVTNGGSNVQPISLKFNENIKLPEVQKNGHSFENWYLDEGLTSLSNVNKMPAENLTLYANWTVNQYTLTFVTNGGDTIQPITQNFGTSLAVPQISKTGHAFNGWYKDSGLTQLYTITSTMRAESLTLYAKWSVNQYAITFVTNGGNNLPNQSIAYGSEILLPSITKTGFSFVGWFSDSSLDTEFSLSTMPAQNLVIYAKWQINQYTMTFVTNGGDPIQPITQNFGTSLAVPQISKTGHVFNGWYKDSLLNQSYTIPSTMPAESLMLYAKWSVNQYTITFVTNNGNNIPVQTYSFGSDISIPNGLRMGFSFIGWYTDSSLENQFLLSTMPAQNLIIYAKWQINQYTMTFVTNGGDPIQPLTQDFGTSISVSQISKAGYGFGGWYKDSGLTQLYNIPSTMPAESLTLYARWNIQLQASNKANDDLFGKSMASYGDYYVVGAPGKYAKNRNNFGTVYLYKYSDRNFERIILPSISTSTFISSDNDNLQFGTSVAIEEDYIVVGAPGHDQPYEGQGAVFVFKISDESYERMLVGERTDDNFGSSVAISNGNIAIGAPNSFGNNTWVGFQNVDVVSGRVYLYKVDNGTYKQSFAPSDVRNGDKFGASISFNNGNLLIGAPFQDNNGSSIGSSHGSAYLYNVTSNVINFQRKFVPSDISDSDNFGYDLAIMGNYFVIGSPGDDDFGESSGSMYLYKISDTNFVRKVTNPSSSSNDFIGAKVSLNNDSILAGLYNYPINDEVNYFKIRGTESLNISSNITSTFGTNFILVSDYELGPGIIYGFEY